MHSVVIIQARVGSERYPRKVLKRIGSRKMLQHVIDRCRRSKANKVVLAIPDTSENDVLVGFGGTDYCRGSEADVLKRYYDTAVKYGAESIVRVTADCPLIDTNIINQVLDWVSEGADYVTCQGYPRGVWCEGFTFDELSRAEVNATKPYQREHVTPYMIDTCIFKGTLRCSSPRDYRLCVDEPADMEMVRTLMQKLGEECMTNEVVALLDAEPSLICNSHVMQKVVCS